MRPGEPILLLCLGFPPNRGVGGRRWAKFAKELARRGHPVHVIRGDWKKGDAVSLWKADGQTSGIIHHPLPRRYPRVLSRRPLTKWQEKVAYHCWVWLLPLRVKGNIYDPAVLSREDVLRTARKLIQAHGIRQVVATGAPFNMLAFAAELKQEFPGLNVVADFRDEWTWMGYYGMNTLNPRQRSEEERKEALVLSTADKVIAPHLAILRHLQDAYGGPPDRFRLIPHPVDPDEMIGVPSHTAGHKGFRMIYAGTLYGTEVELSAYWEALFQAFVTLGDTKGTTTDHRFDLYVTRQNIARLQAMVDARGLADRIVFHQPIPPARLNAEMADSDLVVIFLPDSKRNLLPTKFHEIAYLGIPILHVCEPGLASEAVKQHGFGVSIRVEELVAELPRIVRGERKVVVDPEADVSGFLLSRVTDKLVQEVLV